MSEILNSWNIMAQYEHHGELLREAQKARLVRQALLGQEKKAGSYSRLLAWLGRRLVAWGSHLQERYGAVVTPRTLRPANGHG